MTNSNVPVFVEAGLAGGYLLSLSAEEHRIIPDDGATALGGSNAFSFPTYGSPPTPVARCLGTPKSDFLKKCLPCELFPPLLKLN